MLCNFLGKSNLENTANMLRREISKLEKHLFLYYSDSYTQDMVSTNFATLGISWNENMVDNSKPLKVKFRIQRR